MTAPSIDLASLRAAWARQARRIDSLSLRERAIVFLCIVAVVAALFDTLVLTPATAHARQRADAHNRVAAEVAQLREQFVQASRNAADPAAQLPAQMDAARAERARLDTELRAAGSVGGGEGLSAVLQRLLGRQPGLTLERLTLLDDQPVAVPQPAASGPATPLPGMSWQGVELQVVAATTTCHAICKPWNASCPACAGASCNSAAPATRSRHGCAPSSSC